MSSHARSLSRASGFLMILCSLCLASAEVSGAVVGSQSQFEPQPVGPGHSALDAGLRMTVSLLVVLALIAAGVFLLKRMSSYRSMSGVKHSVLVLSKVPLGQKKSICLVKVADEILVIGLTNTSISLLSKINAGDYFDGGDETYEPSAGYGRSFRRVMDKLSLWNRRASAREKRL